MARVLVIDDDEAIRGMLGLQIVAMGHQVSFAADGLEGAKAYRAAPADLVMIDMMMPHSGLSTIRVLHEQFPNIPMIAMSGASTHRLDFARSLGAAWTLPKPFVEGAVAAAIAAALKTPDKAVGA